MPLVTMSKQEMSKIRENTIANGIAYAEMNEFFAKELIDSGYSSMKFLSHETPAKIILRVAKTDDLIDENRYRLRQITSLIQKKLKRDVVILVEMVKDKGLCPNIQAELIKKKMSSGLTYRRAVNSALGSIKDAGAQGCIIIISGKLKGQRARTNKTIWQTNICSGSPKEEYMREGKATLLLKQGIIGIIVKIMLPHDPEGIKGPSNELPDKIRVLDIKE